MTSEMAEPDSSRASRTARVALFVFGLVEATALVLWLMLGRVQWFFLDEWDFLATRTAGDLGDLFHPHNEHWSTLPILAYRAMWWTVGLRSYVPYQALIVLLHLTAAVLLRVVMRRAGVGPWIATAAASLFALFGAGYANVVWAFQIGFVGALVFGLIHLLLADHDGTVDRRDWLGLLAGVAGLLCSGVAVTMVVVVGLAMLVRRGWRVALLHTAPLGVLYVVWWTALARDNYTNQPATVDEVARFVATGVKATFRALGQVTGVGVALGVVLVVGLVLEWRGLADSEFRRRVGAPAALLVGSVMFLGVTAFGRFSAFGPDDARASRYLHLVAAMVLPAVALAADAVIRRWRLLAPAILALLVVGIPGNIRALADFERDQEQSQRDYKQLILSLPRIPLAKKVPRVVQPETSQASGVTIGWLLGGVASGRIPDPGPITPSQRAADTFRLSIEQTRTASRWKACHPLFKPITRRLGKGQSIGIRGGAGGILVTPASGAHAGTSELLFRPADGETLVAVAGPLTVRLRSTNFYFAVTLCDSAT
jgi:hypothetical protein